jgi:ATP-binding cassette, subfamily C, bacterial CydCD
MREAMRDTRAVLVLGLLATLKGVALVGIAEALARGIVAVIDGDDLQPALTLGAAAVLLRAGAAWATRWAAARAAIGAKSRLRQAFAARLLEGGMQTGRATALGAVGLEEVDELYRSVLPAATAAAAVPLVAGARILTADWVSALIVALTVPLVPVFMILVGKHSQAQADAAARTLDRLSHHLAELARGLPVLVGLGRLEEQADALDRIGREHRTATVRTLRSAFLSSLVLELIATISVAVVAVFVGVRLIDGSLPLTVGLVVLILAPECFQPFREVGAAFHASQDGLTAMRRVRDLVARPVRRAVRIAGGAVRVTGVTVLRAPAVTALTAVFPKGSVTAVTGASGTGKSTLLGVLAGTVAPDAGTVGGVDPDRIAWMPQHPSFVGETVRAELARYARPDEVLDRLGIAHLADADPARLSLGEARRVAAARALLRVESGATLLLLDEPTAHLDAVAADAVLDAVAGLRGRVTIVLASHDAAAIALADRTLELGRQGGARLDTAAAGAASAPITTETPEPEGAALPALASFLQPAAWRFAAAALLGTLASAFAVSLTAVSAWLIVSAAAGPPIMLLLVAIVGVRFFGIGRATLRYAERLLTHDAVLAAVGRLRGRLWRGLARRGAASRALATPETALEHLVVAADRVRDLTPRVLLPVVVAVLVTTGAVITVGLLEPAAVPAIVPIAAALPAGVAVTMLADRSATRAASAARSTVLRRIAALADAADDVRVNGGAGRELGELRRMDADAARSALRGAWALGAGDALVLAACGAAALLALPLAAGAPAPIVAVLALLPLALAEPLAAACAAAQQVPALAAALRRVGAVEGGADERPHPIRGPVRSIRMRSLTARWSPAADDAFAPLTAEAAAGRPLIVEGPSGAGKSTLLAVLLGQLPASGGDVVVDGVPMDPAALRDRVAWCPQDAHLFDSSIRGNLLLATPGADDDRLRGALRMVGLAHPLDRRVGAGGAELSGGERQRLAVARAILADRDIVLLDEPTAHLDATTAAALMRDVRRALGDRILVVVTHHADDVAPGDEVVVLGRSLIAA